MSVDRIEWPAAQRTSWWVAHLESEGEPRAEGRIVAAARDGRRLRLRGQPDDGLPLVAADERCALLWHGILHNGRALLEGIAEPSERFADEAQVVLRAYRARGEDCFAAIRGVFAFVLWDLAEDAFFCVRDPMGIHPLFFAEAGKSIAVSDSIDCLLEISGVDSRPSRASIAMYLSSLPMRRERTFFEGVSRVPSGHRLRIVRGRKEIGRYWDPAPLDRPIEWLRADEVGQFQTLFDQAVERCLRQGEAAIFLSGGLDSGAISAVAADHCRRSGAPTPKAFSLLFPHPECNEEEIQRGVARTLGLEHVMLPFDDALNGGGLLQPAARISGMLPAPLDNFWLPAYFALTQVAKRSGCRSVITGIGGDEWLSITPVIAADMIPALDVAGLWRMWNVFAASYRRPRLPMTRNLLWTSGLRPLLGEVGARVLGHCSPRLLDAKRRASRAMPDWISRDRSLRDEIEAGTEPVLSAKECGSFYAKELRIALDHYIVSMELEESFEIAQRGGLPRFHPFLDADLVGLLYRTPPEILCRGGRVKGLVRGMLAERFPQLGFEQQRKRGATLFFREKLTNEGPKIWNWLGKRLALAEAGVLDEKRWRLTLQHMIGHPAETQVHFAWLVGSAESWVRPRIPVGDRNEDQREAIG